MLFFTPPVVPVTVTLNWQGLLPPVPIDAPLRLITPVELVVISVPLQVGGLESGTVNPPRSVSLKATPGNAGPPVGLGIVNLSCQGVALWVGVRLQRCLI